MPKGVCMTNTSTQRFVRDERYRVVKKGGYLRGFRPIVPESPSLQSRMV